MSLTRPTLEALEVVLEAAERRALELLNQASKYEALNQPNIAEETYKQHYKPVRDAIETVRKETGL